MTGSSESRAVQHGQSFESRYWVTWIVLNAGQRRDLRCNFDHIQDAINHIAQHPQTNSGGIWDRRENRWVL